MTKGLAAALQYLHQRRAQAGVTCGLTPKKASKDGTA